MTIRAKHPHSFCATALLVLSFVKKLRAKLGNDAASSTYIFNERGVGYRMPKPGEE